MKSRAERPRTDPSELYVLGGVSLVASGILFQVTAIAEMIAGPPPRSGLGILMWATSSGTALKTVDEVAFFAIMFLVPGVIALHRSLAAGHPSAATAGCGMIAVMIPVMLVADVILGRLVYPVYDVKVADPSTAALAAALYIGCLHITDLVFAAATIVLALAMRRSAYGRAIANLGFVTGVVDLVAAYPWLLGPLPLLLARALAAAWLVAVGARLYGLRRMPSNVAVPSGPDALA